RISPPARMGSAVLLNPILPERHRIVNRYTRVFACPTSHVSGGTSEKIPGKCGPAVGGAPASGEISHDGGSRRTVGFARGLCPREARFLGGAVLGGRPTACSSFGLVGGELLVAAAAD